MKRYLDNGWFGKRNYLQLMDIDVWQVRTFPSMNYYCYSLYNLKNRLVGVLLADAIVRNDAENQLIKNIAKATRRQVCEGFRLKLLNHNDLKECIMILLGSRVSQLFSHFDPLRMIVSYAPAELLRDATLKVKTWNALKKAMRLMEF
ncbi:hypothetical protein [Coxiella endosymbiont of Amblyomma nuttalli]|uniref:hypothetical protein n=1 Tax=Coxiella endosymbiont of Amblyomma nuttalli TaxID=2749996 RepID=UPI001BAB062A|nr:hypothetical protein [Coxiella endosymbiont of Amblyomma nuttalli]QTS84091.1 hypothetical protein CEAn_00588 [Coxiella endosymbiont of Amblyomma nuttalli]